MADMKTLTIGGETFQIVDAQARQDIERLAASGGGGGSGEGTPGKDGVGIYSIEQAVTSTADGGENVIVVTLTDQTTATFSIRNGGKGGKGDKGDTPKKGTDYFTAADKSEMVSAVLAALPAYAGEVENA